MGRVAHVAHDWNWRRIHLPHASTMFFVALVFAVVVAALWVMSVDFGGRVAPPPARMAPTARVIVPEATPAPLPAAAKVPTVITIDEPIIVRGHVRKHAPREP
jgi:hypothetical protein